YYGTSMHDLCITQLEIAIRLRRGLNVVLGMVGTGKSTLARRLLRSLSGNTNMESYLLLDAGAQNAPDFRRKLAALMGGDAEEAARADGMSALQDLIYKKALDEEKNLVLIIDEGQKLSQESMEILRELLNFETNTEKLLQIVIFAQPEFKQAIDASPNFHDRINALSYLFPLSKKEAANLMRHRLRLAGGEKAVRLFSAQALRIICRASGGRPRQLIRLGHHCLLSLIMSGKSQVSASMAKAVAEREGAEANTSLSSWPFLLCFLTALLLLLLLPQAASQLEPVCPTPVSPAEAQKNPQEIPHEASQEEHIPSLGIIAAGKTAENLAVLCYGTAEAAPALRSANPEWDGKTSANIVLPLLEYAVPERYTKNFLLSLSSYASAEEALSHMEHFAELRPRFLARKEADGSIRFHITAPASFSAAGRAFGWLSGRSVPPDVHAELLPPYAPGEMALYFLPR
ncbi:MAG: ExeA family protein, partial [Mailhella sp.]